MNQIAAVAAVQEAPLKYLVGLDLGCHSFQIVNYRKIGNFHLDGFRGISITHTREDREDTGNHRFLFFFSCVSYEIRRHNHRPLP